MRVHSGRKLSLVSKKSSEDLYWVMSSYIVKTSLNIPLTKWLLNGEDYSKFDLSPSEQRIIKRYCGLGTRAQSGTYMS